MAMKSLYNSTVVSAKWVHRPLQMKEKLLEVLGDLIEHQGILVKLDSGKEYLIHIVPKSKAVITDSIHMTSKWTCCKSIARCKITIAKLMASVEQEGIYDLLSNNCYTIAIQVWKLIAASQI